MENTDIVNEIVTAVVHGNTDVDIEPTLSDVSEVNTVKTFMNTGCGCKTERGKQFVSSFHLNI